MPLENNTRDNLRQWGLTNEVNGSKSRKRLIKCVSEIYHCNENTQMKIALLIQQNLSLFRLRIVAETKELSLALEPKHGSCDTRQ